MDKNANKDNSKDDKVDNNQNSEENNNSNSNGNSNNNYVDSNPYRNFAKTKFEDINVKAVKAQNSDTMRFISAKVIKIWHISYFGELR